MAVQRLTKRDYRKVLSGKATDGYIKQFIKDYLADLEDIGYYRTKPSTEYLGDLYVEQVESGLIPTSKKVKAAVKAYKDKRDNEGSDWWPYRWDVDKAYHFVRWVETYTYLGKDGTNTVLQTHQHHRLGQLFGWVDEDGKRVIDYYFDLIGRGNGKSVEKALVAVYLLFNDPKLTLSGMYSSGTIKTVEGLFKQNVINGVLPHLASELQDLLDTSNSRELKFNSELRDSGTLSEFRVAPTTQKTSHGLNLDFIFVDELHTLSQDSLGVVDTLARSQHKVQQPIIMYSSTRDETYSDSLEEEVSESVDALNNPRQSSNNKKLIYIYELDNKDQLFSFDQWIAANPNIMIMNIFKLIQGWLRVSKQRDTRDYSRYVTTQFNITDDTDTTSYITMQMIKKNVEQLKDYEQYRDNPTYIGIDFGGEDDFTYALALTPFTKERVQKRDTKLHKKGDLLADEYIAFKGKAFMTQSNYENKKTTGKFDFLDEWLDMGILELMGDDKPNGVELDRYIKELLTEYDVKAIAIDPNGTGSDEFESRWVADGYDELIKPMKLYRTNTSATIQTIQRHFRSGRAVFNQDPAMEYFLLNAELDKGETGKNPTRRWWFDKPKKDRNAKIDGADALKIAYKAFTDDGGYGQMEQLSTSRTFIDPFDIYDLDV